MPPTAQMMSVHVGHAPVADVMGRQEYGVTKNRKSASTGGGRAWSEDEEAYLLQTRLQKMPYKHIAAHLKKTELACRLHYHQLSHGSSRRKRTTSVSSGSSTGSRSPLMAQTRISPVREVDGVVSRSESPPTSVSSYHSSPQNYVQLPSILSATASCGSSPRLPAILPKPASLALASATGTAYPVQPLAEPQPLRMAAPTPTQPALSYHQGPLRFDCSPTTLPPLASVVPASASTSASAVDVTRLQALYSTHRGAFWAAIAAEYGPGADPAVLEHAWRSGTDISVLPRPSNVGKNAPITPIGSPDLAAVRRHGAQADKTRISAILGIDASPRSPREREAVRRMEAMCVTSAVGA